MDEALPQEEQMILNIFDFDGTLFKSPLPNSRLWNSDLIAKLKAQPSEKGLGWFQEPITLSPPYVPASPGPEWWNLPLLEVVKESMANPDCVTVLLTGRSTQYQDILHTLTKHAGLEFNEIGLKPVQQDVVIKTMDFKRNFITSLMEKYKPVTKVQLWEDRPDHVKKFSDFFAKDLAEAYPGGTYIVHEADAGDIVLAEKDERELVDALLKKNGQGLELRTFVEWTGVFLDKPSKKKLMDAYYYPTVRRLERLKKAKYEATATAKPSASLVDVVVTSTSTTTTETIESAVPMIHALLGNVVKDAVSFSEQAERKTVTAMDVVNALRKQPLFGDSKKEHLVPAVEGKEKENENEKEKEKESEKEKGKETKEEIAKRQKEEKERKKKEVEDAIHIEDLTWTPKCHHMTMTLGPITEKTFASRQGLDPQLYALTREVELTVVAFGMSKRAMAVKVETDAPSVNAIPHITVGISIIGKAKDSNEIREWTPVTLDEEEEGNKTEKEESEDKPVYRRIKLKGTIKEWQSTGLARPAPPPKPAELKINYGKLLKQYHPTISGPQIGKAVKAIKEWAESTPDITSEAQVEEYIKTSLKVD